VFLGTQLNSSFLVEVIRVSEHRLVTHPASILGNTGKVNNSGIHIFGRFLGVRVDFWGVQVGYVDFWASLFIRVYGKV
jgi:hypothetical protein